MNRKNRKRHGGGFWSARYVSIVSIVLLIAFYNWKHFGQLSVDNVAPSNLIAGNNIEGIVTRKATAAAPSPTTNKVEQEVQEEEEGWRTIHVFYGKEKEVDAQAAKPGQWFSQISQDRIVVELLKNSTPEQVGGYFLDLAANDPIEFSNTLALERRGWTGLCIEPNPSYWYGLAAHRTCTVVGALVGGNNIEKVKFDFNGVFGEIVFDAIKSKTRGTQTLYTAGFAGLLEKFQVPKTIDYLSLDVEGAEYFIMQNFPFQKYMIRVMTIERPSDELRALLEANGYIYLKTFGWFGETLWAHQSMGFTPNHPVIETTIEQIIDKLPKKKKRKN